MVKLLLEHKDININRYLDWSITTPIMLLVLILTFSYTLKRKVRLFDFMIIVALNFLMLMFGFMGESKQLDKAKSDYKYVVSKAELLGNNAISQSSNIEEIELFIRNLLQESISNLVIVEEESSLIVSFKTNNLKESISISDEIAFRLGKELSKISYSNNEEDSITKLFFN